jgi:hypothetical protein
MKIYIHTADKMEPEAVEASEDTTVSSALGTDDDDIVLAEDREAPVNLGASLTQAEIADRGHVFVGRVRKLTVDVEFNNLTKSEEFPPSARVAKVLDWAVGKDGFDLSKADAAEHTLALCASGEIPAPDVHIGSLPQMADKPQHVCFQLIPKHRYEG